MEIVVCDDEKERTGILVMDEHGNPCFICPIACT